MQRHIPGQKLILWLLFRLANAQIANPDEDDIYREREIAIINLSMGPADSAFLLDDDNVLSNEYLPTGFQFTDSQTEINSLEVKDMLGRKQEVTFKAIDNSLYQLDFNLTSGLYIIYTDGYSSKFLVK